MGTGKMKLEKAGAIKLKAGRKETSAGFAALAGLIVLPVVAWLFYSGLFVNGRINTGGTETNYFKDLAVSFRQGRLDIDRAKGQTTLYL